VICVGSSAAREAAGSKSYPSDLTIVGIIDHWDPDAAKEMAAGKPSAAANPAAASSDAGKPTTPSPASPPSGGAA
jgi:hypothetical protein